MADYLASIYGTERDKVNCSFYFKIGACRHGDRCSRLHNKPTFSQTVLLLNMYQNPANVPVLPDGRRGADLSKEELQEHFDEFFADLFWEMEDKYGPIEDMNVCDNLGDHLIGNVYVMFENEEDAEQASVDLNNRWYGGRPIQAELSPVTDFREACCRQYEKSSCNRGGFCNFMHLRPLSRPMRKELFGSRVRVSEPGRDEDRGGRGGGFGGGRGGGRGPPRDFDRGGGYGRDRGPPRDFDRGRDYGRERSRGRDYDERPRDYGDRGRDYERRDYDADRMHRSSSRDRDRERDHHGSSSSRHGQERSHRSRSREPEGPPRPSGHPEGAPPPPPLA